MVRKFSDMIVMLPGISGSLVQRGGRDVWALSKQAPWHQFLNEKTVPDQEPRYCFYPAIFQDFQAEEGMGLIPMRRRIAEVALGKVKRIPAEHAFPTGFPVTSARAKPEFGLHPCRPR
jgi:hypothetical protein